MERCDRVLARKTKFPIGMGTKAEDITDRRGTATLMGLGRFGADGGGGKAGRFRPADVLVGPRADGVERRSTAVVLPSI